ncbi:MAG: sigma-70 family RNA polymerase sigma factor [Candidatus Moranbacteria bacterium]|nr:sigma-70 family RNA polymerase sigma factor [Candidatus Moranbacteria bacterium]
MPERDTEVEESAQLLAGAFEEWSPEEILASKIPQKRKEEIFVNRYLQKVRELAGQMAYRLPADVHADDLVGAGLLGLVGAMSKFDPSRQGRFWTYATFRVKGAMLNELRYMDVMPRSFRDRMKILGKARSQMTKILGRKPSEEELIEHLGISLETYNELANIESTRFVSLDDLRGYSAQQSEPVENVYRKIGMSSISSFLCVLPQNEQLVLREYYYENRTMRAIAKEMGFTPPRVSQFHAQAILRLKIVNAASEALKKGGVPDLSFLEAERKSWMMGLNRSYQDDMAKIGDLTANSNFRKAVEAFLGEGIDATHLSFRIFLYLEPLEIQFLWFRFVKGYHQSKAVRILNLNLRTAQRWKKGLFQKMSLG